MFDFSFVLTYSIYRMKKEDAMKLVIVESPTKCHTIQQFLGKDYEVVASMGHIRDLSTTGKVWILKINFTRPMSLIKIRKKSSAIF